MCDMLLQLVVRFARTQWTKAVDPLPLGGARGGLVPSLTLPRGGEQPVYEVSFLNASASLR